MTRLCIVVQLNRFKYFTEFAPQQSGGRSGGNTNLIRCLKGNVQM